MKTQISPMLWSEGTHSVQMDSEQFESFNFHNEVSTEKATLPALLLPLIKA